MHKIKNIFPMIYDFENLFNAYKAGIKCKRYRPDVMAYTDKLEENLIELQNEFIWQTYTVGRYNIFYVYEPKKRMIMSLTFKDRVAQHAIYSQLNPYFEKQFISDSYACRVGRGTHKAVNRLHDWLKQTDRKPQRFYYLKLDIAKYFYRIDHEVLMDILRKKIADEDLLHVLSVIINCEDTNFGLPLGADIGDVAFDELLGEVGLPIGNLTSQMFANLYLNELDQFCKHKLHLHYYIRYMDDIIILHPDKKYLEKIKNKIADFLGNKLHLQLNKKTCIRPTSMGIEFVGFRIWSTHVKLRKKTAKKLKRRLKYMFAVLWSSFFVTLVAKKIVLINLCCRPCFIWGSITIITVWTNMIIINVCKFFYLLIECFLCCKLIQICAFILQGIEVTLHRCIVVRISCFAHALCHIYRFAEFGKCFGRIL